ncbi:MAG: transcription elongation factor GreA [Oligoflexia bacterium]|nr:transcription elongation factor GreA [Oligoflexia bacterium]
MAEDTVPMTLAGKKKLEEELKNLLSVERPQVIKAIEVAREQGDLSENAEYDSAKERQAFIEGRIQEINSKLARAQVIDPAKIKSDKIVFGATVVLEDAASGNGKKIKYQIVGVDEADAQHGKISINSPIARALIGKAEGEIVSVNTPGGIKEFEVLEFSFQ